MRRGHSNSKLIEEKETFYGISLGYDFCAEHEWGIEKLKNKLGIDNNKMGIDGRKITKKDTAVVFLKEGDEAVLITKPWSFNDKKYTFKELINRDLSLYDKEELATAWDGDSFGIHVKGDKNVNKLENIYEAFKKNDIAIASIKGDIPAFSNSSLSVLIASNLPKEVTDSMYHVDKEHKDLLDYEKEIGITELKEQAKSSGYRGIHYFMACSPKWIDYNNAENREKRKKELGTKYDISYWINYSDDDDNYGWYKAEEIKQWLSTPGLKLTQIRKAK